jgi:uncharacterized protein YciI
LVDALIERGIFVMGGPLQATTRASMSPLEGVDADEARRILEDDPFMKNGVFVLEEIRE